MSTEFPEFCLCPITFEVMTDPVIVGASCQHTVERTSLETWVGAGHSSCPLCGAALQTLKASPNAPLREAIELLRAGWAAVAAHPVASSSSSSDDLATAPHSSRAVAPSASAVAWPSVATAVDNPPAPALPSPPPSATALPSATAAAHHLSAGPASSSSGSSPSVALAASTGPREERCNIGGWCSRGWGTYHGEFNARGERHGTGTMRWDNGDVYEGEWKDGATDGRGTMRWSDGRARVSRFCADRLAGEGFAVGEGVQWSADRRTAWRTEGGMRMEKISLARAETVAARIGLPVPDEKPNLTANE